MTTAVFEQNSVHALREAALQRFEQLGFPTSHDEEWRFTNIAPIAKFFQSRDTDQSRDRQGAVPSPALIPDAARPHLAQHARYDRNPFVALNTAYFGDLTFYEVPRNAAPTELIQIVHRGPPNAVHYPRSLILIGANAQCTILETYEGEGPHFTNAVTEIVAGEGAVIDHYKIQRESLEAFHVATMHATLGRSANFSSHSVSLGGALVRNDANVTLSEGSEAILNGLYIVNGRQHVDNHTEIDHAKPHGTS
ncbi:MAG: SufD family Fe-S cluster assembly protein, partial [Acidobacteriia bacterium]|nr:SufD family Fe-S cluster assembly protein [Terriglobia bacterium]